MVGPIENPTASKKIIVQGVAGGRWGKIEDLGGKIHKRKEKLRKIT